MSIQAKWYLLAGLLLAAVGYDDWRRAHASVAAPAVAATAAASTHVEAAPAVASRETERVVTQLKCSDGTSVTQTDLRAGVETAAAPVAVNAMASATIAQPPIAVGSEYDAYKYSLRVDTNPLAPRDIGVSVGFRLGGLPAEVVAGCQLTGGHLSPRVGIQLDL